MMKQSEKSKKEQCKVTIASREMHKRKCPQPNKISIRTSAIRHEKNPKYIESVNSNESELH